MTNCQNQNTKVAELTTPLHQLDVYTHKSNIIALLKVYYLLMY